MKKRISQIFPKNEKSDENAVPFVSKHNNLSKYVGFCGF